VETLIWIGNALFVVLAVASAARAMHLNRRFQRHLEEHHHEQWQRIYQDQLVKKAVLWPFMRDTPVDFLWKSQETFGDHQIADFRRGIRQSFLGAISAGIAAVVWFGIGAMILESVTRR
jgi:hypothetical protein